MLPRLLNILVGLSVAASVAAATVAPSAAGTLQVAVLENSPPMSFRDSDGRLTGFSVEVVQAVCAEMKVRCEFRPMVLDRVVDALAGGEIDIAAVSLLDTPERRRRILLAQPHFRSITLWFARPGVEPGQRGLRVAVVKGSAQETYARKQNWDTVGVPTSGELGAPLLAGIALAAIVPMNTSLHLQSSKEFQRLGLAATVMTVPDLVGNASFGINPRRPELKIAVDDALERIKLNGVYERINTQFLPFRVQ